MIPVSGTLKNMRAAVYRMKEYDTLGLKGAGKSVCAAMTLICNSFIPLLSLDIIKPSGKNAFSRSS